MARVIYRTQDWIPVEADGFIYSHAHNRKLNPEQHCHDFFEIIFIFNGSGEHWVNGRTQWVEFGDVTVLRPGDEHLFTAQTEELELFSISAIPEKIHPFLEAYSLRTDMLDGSEPVSFRLSKNQTLTALRLFQKLALVGNIHERNAILRAIIGSTMQSYLLQSMENGRDWFESVLYRMRSPENLAEGVSAMMRLANLSHAQLCRTMKRLSLSPPRVYVRELRLSTAYEMIQNTSLSFEEIAAQVGYASVSHFSTAFKQRYNLSPGALRKRSMPLL